MVDNIEKAAQAWNQATRTERKRFLELAKISYPGACKYRFDSLGALYIGKLVKAITTAARKQESRNGELSAKVR